VSSTKNNQAAKKVQSLKPEWKEFVISIKGGSQEMAAIISANMFEYDDNKAQYHILAIS